MHKIQNKNNTIELMNRLGREKTPFLFIIDFEMQQPVVIETSKTNNKNIIYDIEGDSNCPLIQNPNPKEIQFRKVPVTKEVYSEMFWGVMQNIKAGNSYLLNLTCPTPIEINLELKEIFLLSRAKYKLFFNNQFVCFSPETFVKIQEGKISSYPMKGTIDASIPDAEEIILNDKKETAEHYTIVDLIRNDLGIVAKNVKVEKFRYVDRIKTNQKELLQISSVVTGELDNDYNCKIGDIIFSLLPAGSVSGAPKEKTVEIILHTENYKRGFYTGVFGIFDGVNLNSAVTIRFIENTGAGLVYKSGGGITSFSDLDSEYNEMIDKVYVPVIRNN